MISKKLRTIFLISIPLFVAHGLEEYFTGFYNVDSIFQFIIQPLDKMSFSQGAFLEFQILFWLLLVIAFFLLQSRKTALYLMTILGVFFILELEHIAKAVISGNYYPGLVTATLFPFIGFFYWKELLREFKAGK